MLSRSFEKGVGDSDEDVDGYGVEFGPIYIFLLASRHKTQKDRLKRSKKAMRLKLGRMVKENKENVGLDRATQVGSDVVPVHQEATKRASMTPN